MYRSETLSSNQSGSLHALFLNGNIVAGAYSRFDNGRARAWRGLGGL